MANDEPNITLDQVRVFLRVVDEGSFSRAAVELNRAQSAVSYAIANLERLLDLQLFDRRGSQAQLTMDGQTLVPPARDLVAQTSRFLQEAEAIREGIEAELRVAVDGLVPMTRVASAMAVVKAEFPAATISLRSEALGAVPELLLHRRVDVGLSPHLPQHSKVIEAQPFGRVEMVCVAAPGVAPDAHPQIVIRDRTRLTENVSFAIVGGSQYHVADAHTKLELLQLGMGWGMFPREQIEEELHDGRLRVLTGQSVPAAIPVPHYVGWRRDTDLGRVGLRFVQALLLEALPEGPRRHLGPP